MPDLVMRGSSLPLKRVDYQDSHPGQASMLLLHIYIIDGSPSKNNHPFFKKQKAVLYKSSPAVKIPIPLLCELPLPKQIGGAEFAECGDVPVSQLKMARARACVPRAQGAATLPKALLVWQRGSGTADRISLLRVLR